MLNRFLMVLIKKLCILTKELENLIIFPITNDRSSMGPVLKRERYKITKHI